MIFALETSCDDTCASVLDSDGRVLSNVVSSQHEIHDQYQGVVPELASRKHAENINYVMKEARGRTEHDWGDIQRVAVTYGPGLVGSLLTGIAAAKSLALRHDLPLVPVNHIEAHVYSVFLEHEPDYPFVSLVASGGHTALFLVEDVTSFGVLGHTQDDAVGEAYDKVAKMLDLGYPGGPAVEDAARDGDPESFDFPRPTLGSGGRWNWNMDDYDFSFSGIKTAVYYEVRDMDEIPTSDVAASFQRAANDCLVYKTLEAAREHDISTVAVGGGVAANTPLRESFEQRSRQSGIEVLFPSLKNCTDNAAMIGLRASQIERTADLNLNAQPSLSSYSPKDTKTEALKG